MKMRQNRQRLPCTLLLENGTSECHQARDKLWTKVLQTAGCLWSCFRSNPR